MAHEYLAFRRLDRIYHRGTFIEDGKTFFALLAYWGSVLAGASVAECWVCLVAIMRGLISDVDH
jgi:hypothetical protein